MTAFSKAQFIQENEEEIERLVTKFAGYMAPISRSSLIRFLRAFDAVDMPTALKLLQNVDYYSNDRVGLLIRTLIRKIKQETNSQLNDVYFCLTDSSTGSSTDSVIRKLRNELRLESDQYSEKFIRNIADLMNFAINIDDQISTLKQQIVAIENRPKFDDDLELKNEVTKLQLDIADLELRKVQSRPETIVFIDDFIGSGRSIVEFWDGISGWYNEKISYYFAVIVGHREGIEYIKANTPLKVITATPPIPYTKKVFHSRNPAFTQDEKTVLKKYCEDMGFSRSHRYGFFNTQSLVIFYERSSNNVLPILYSRKNNWPAPFPRNRFPPDDSSEENFD